MTTLRKMRKSLRYPAIVLGSYLTAFNPVRAQETQIEQGVNNVRPDDVSSLSVEEIIQNIINALLFIVGIASVIMLIIGGIRYVVSAGDQNAVTGAKNTILYAIVGIIISFLAFALVNFVINRLGGDTNTGTSVFMFMNALA